MNAEISETIRARLLRLGMHIPELLTQRKFVSQTAQNSGSYSFTARTKMLTEMYCPHKYLSIGPKKDCHAHFDAHKPPTNSKKS